MFLSQWNIKQLTFLENAAAPNRQFQECRHIKANIARVVSIKFATFMFELFSAIAVWKHCLWRCELDFYYEP